MAWGSNMASGESNDDAEIAPGGEFQAKTIAKLRAYHAFHLQSKSASHRVKLNVHHFAGNIDFS